MLYKSVFLLRIAYILLPRLYIIILCITAIPICVRIVMSTWKMYGLVLTLPRDIFDCGPLKLIYVWFNFCNSSTYRSSSVELHNIFLNVVEDDIPAGYIIMYLYSIHILQT